jgi:hypothetical protein
MIGTMAEFFRASAQHPEHCARIADTAADPSDPETERLSADDVEAV